LAAHRANQQENGKEPGKGFEDQKNIEFVGYLIIINVLLPCAVPFP